MSILTSIALALGLSQSPVILISAHNGTTTKQLTTSKPDKRIKRERIKRSYQHFLLPVTKQSFKQNQRKELKVSARKKSRK